MQRSETGLIGGVDGRSGSDERPDEVRIRGEMKGRVAGRVDRLGIRAAVQQEPGSDGTRPVLTGEQKGRPSVLIQRIQSGRVVEKEPGHVGRVVLGRPMEGRPFLLVDSADAGLALKEQFQEVRPATAGGQMEGRQAPRVALIDGAAPVEEETDQFDAVPLDAEAQGGPLVGAHEEPGVAVHPVGQQLLGPHGVVFLDGQEELGLKIPPGNAHLVDS